MLEKIEGIVESIIYTDEKSFTIFLLNIRNKTNNIKASYITCTAGILVSAGENIRLEGRFIVHLKYGEQFKADMIYPILPHQTTEIIDYLITHINNIGPARAKAIVAKFGQATFDIIEHKPDLLVGIKNISVKLANDISNSFNEQHAQRNTYIYFNSLGISYNQCKKIIEKYGANALQYVKANPYALIEDIQGIGFKIADNIGFRLGIAKDSKLRIRAGVVYILQEAQLTGHTFLPKTDVLTKTAEILSLDNEKIEQVIPEMQLKTVIKQEKHVDNYYIYLMEYYKAEVFVSKRLLEINYFAKKNYKFGRYNIAAKIKKIEKTKEVSLAKKQREAVEEALYSGVMIITGGPGTGKTTTINTIISIMQSYNMTITLAAPTGRAAKRMSQATGKPASTIHRLLGEFFCDTSNEHDFDEFLLKTATFENKYIDTDCIIIDEMSMVDIMLINTLLKYVKNGTKLIFVGDVDQLPSVGAGNVLKDIINSNVFKTVYLNEIFRQSQQSDIIMNAHRINNGKYPNTNDKGTDFFFMQRSSTHEAISTIVELATHRLPSFYNVDKLKDIQVLSPQRRTPLGTYELNFVLQKFLNPKNETSIEKELGGSVYRVGDKVMHIKNNYELAWKTLDIDTGEYIEGSGVFNGDAGVISFIDNDSQELTVYFDDGKIANYKFSQLSELMHAYAITIHKSQGSDYEIVIIPLFNGPPMLLTRNLLYTAVTRAKKAVVIVGLKETMHKMVDNAYQDMRHSALKCRIQRKNNFVGFVNGAS